MSRPRIQQLRRLFALPDSYLFAFIFWKWFQKDSIDKEPLHPSTLSSFTLECDALLHKHTLCSTVDNEKQKGKREKMGHMFFDNISPSLCLNFSNIECPILVLKLSEALSSVFTP